MVNSGNRLHIIHMLYDKQTHTMHIESRSPPPSAFPHTFNSSFSHPIHICKAHINCIAQTSLKIINLRHKINISEFRRFAGTSHMHNSYMKSVSWPNE